mgnify:CR=1 FL=1
MTENFKIIGSFIKDMSSETPDTSTYIFVRDKISKYKLNIDINSKAVKDGIIEVNIIIKFLDQPKGRYGYWYDQRSGCLADGLYTKYFCLYWVIRGSK